MKVNYFEPIYEILKKISIQLEGEFDVEVEANSVLVPALRSVKLTEGELLSIFVLRTEEEAGTFSDFFDDEANNNFLQNVVVYSDQALKVEPFKKYPISSNFRDDIPNNLRECEKPLPEIGGANYKKVNIYSFSQFNNAPVDIYIRLSEDKYVKVVNKSDMYSNEVIDKYKKRSVRYLYVEKDDFSLYLEDLSSSLSYLIDDNILNQSSKLSLEKLSLDIVHKTLSSIGITENTIELTNKVLNSVLASVETDKRLMNVLRKSVLEIEHAAEHAIAISYLCTSMLEVLKWDSVGTLSKMAISAFFHDLSLKATLSFVRDLEGDLFKSLNKQEVEEFLSHPESSVLILRDIKRLPPNVEDIILEHHERPSGLGFPRKKTSFTITPLTCVFIIAEEFWYRINRTAMEKEDTRSVMNEMRNTFSEGNFKKPFSALEFVLEERV